MFIHSTHCDIRMQNNYARHHHFTMLIHWISALTIIVLLGAIFFREFLEDDELRLTLLNLHRSFGVLLLILVIVRLFIRYFYYFSEVTSALPKTLQKIAKATHIVIYFFLLAVPISGWLLTSAAGKPLVFFGFLHLPALLQKNRDVAEIMGDVHEVLAWTFIAFIVAHILAALWHHYVRKDNVLRSILPARLVKK